MTDGPRSADVPTDHPQIAVIGMSGRFPGARDVRAFWHNLRNGVDAISRFTDEELVAAGVARELLDDPAYVRAGAVLDDIDLFDAEFFGLTPAEAAITDPQQRLFLEHCWTALEHAGHDHERLSDVVGVFGGCAFSTYLHNNLLRRPDVLDTFGATAVGLGNDKDSLTTRVAHTMGFTGPAYSVQSYCSTSLVAVAAAATSLVSGECDLALAGGVSVAVPHRHGYLYRDGGMASADGACRPFDARADGTPLGGGVGVVVLRRLEDALADRDHVYAVVRGWAVHNDGGRKAGFTAPGVDGQATVVAEALDHAGLDPADIDYLEAHGTGTRLGDAAELMALRRVFADSGRLAIGSAKSNVGHLDRAAGVTGLIKTVLALHHERIPPTLHVTDPVPELAEAGLEVVTRTRPWPRSERRRRAGVSAFGIGGTNAHVVLEEAPVASASGTHRPRELLVWSARSPEAADAATAELADALARPGAALPDAAFTLRTGRRKFEHRRAVVAGSPADAVEALRAGVHVMSRTDATADRPIAFLLTGVGEQYPGMARELVAAEPRFAEVVRDCSAFLRDVTGHDPVAELLDAERAVRPGRLTRPGEPAAGSDRTSRTEIAQPAVFVVEYALCRLLEHWGLRPDLMLGYSLGEFVAAAVSGVLTWQEALHLVAYRADAISRLPAGAMLAVPLDEQRLAGLCAEHDGLDVAAVNGPAMSVAAGPPDAVGLLARQLLSQGVPSRVLSATHAFHTGMLRPIAGDLAEWARTHLRPRAPRIPYLSNVTGRPVGAEVADPGYWAEHMCSPVRFHEAVGTLMADEARALVEIGPGQSLGAMVRGNPACPRDRWPLIVPTLPSAAEQRDANTVLAESLGKLWLCGVTLDWAAYHEDRPVRRIALPTYPFRRRRHWVDGPESTTALAPSAEPSAEPSAAGVPFDEGWLTVPRWRRDAGDAGELPRTCVLLDDGLGVAPVLAESLAERGVRVVRAADGLGAVQRTTPEPGLAVVDLRPLGVSDVPTARTAFLDVCALANALGGRAAVDGARLLVATRNAHAVSPGDRPTPAASLVQAPCVVVGQEYGHLSCTGVDVPPPDGDADWARRTADVLVGELHLVTDQPSVAYRSGARHVLDVEPVGAGAEPVAAIRPGGTYLVTGGLGGVGPLLAEHITRTPGARVVLTGRRGLSGAGRPAAAAVAALRARGREVEVETCDVTDLDAVRGLVSGIRRRCGRLDGVVHAAATTTPETFRPLGEVDEAAVRAHFDPKVDGVEVLRQVLDGADVDFCVLFSSVSTVLGGIGFATYCAANAFLDATAAAEDSAATRWLSVDWDTWLPTLDTVRGPVREAMSRHAMSTAGAVTAFDRVLAAGRPRALVATGDLAARMRQWRASPATRPRPAAGTTSPRPPLPQEYVPPTTPRQRRLAELCARLLGLDRVGLHDNFFDLGGNSLLGLQLIGQVGEAFGVRLPAVALFEAPTVATLAGLLPDSAPAPAAAPARRSTGPAIVAGTEAHCAVIGIAGRFPGARDVDAFWANLAGGVESIRFFTDEELTASGVAPRLLADPAYVRARPVLEDVDRFDAELFGYSPREAALADPQQRLFLETVWEALEHAGYGASAHRGRVGVFGGSNVSTYLLDRYRALRASEAANDYELVMGNDKDALTTTVSYRLDLRGPSLSVQSFCSTSLVAVHLARQSLLRGECDLAVAGGVSVRVPDRIGHLFRPGGMESPDGHVRAFDADARGSMFGDGSAVVVLKNLDRALADGDTVWGVIRGSAINNDGSRKVGYTAPSVTGQAAVVAAAMRDAGVAGDEFSFVEAHGTGTELGDPIEVAALSRAFGKVPAAGCLIGSVKTNVGHLDRAAGTTGLIKTLLALRHETIPATLHYRRPNPRIDFAASPFRVAAEPVPWPRRTGAPRVAGINSLGMGGTNAHVVVQEPPAVPERPVPARRYHLLGVSARSADAVEEYRGRLGRFLADRPGDLADLAYTLHVGRELFTHRRVAVGATTAELADAFNGPADPRWSRADPLRERPVAFVFDGAGTYHPHCAGALCPTEPAFRQAFDECVTALEEHGPPDVADAVRRLGAEPADVTAAGSAEFADSAAFAVEYASARLLTGWGLAPVAVLGRGVGECVAACVAGVLSVADAVRLVLRRARNRTGLVEWVAAHIRLREPRMVFRSAGEVTDPAFWAGREDGSDRLADVLRTLADEQSELAVVGFGAGSADAAGDHPAVHVLPPPADPRPADLVLAEALARLWLAGVPVDWNAYHGASAEAGAGPRRVPAPTYPFQRRSYWLDAPPVDDTRESTATDPVEGISALPRLSEEDWLHLPVWRQTPPPPQPETTPSRWLVLDDGGRHPLPDLLVEAGADVRRVHPGPGFAPTGDGGFAVRAGDEHDATALALALRRDGWTPDRVLHLCTADRAGDVPTGAAEDFLALLALVRGLATTGMLADCRVDVVCAGVHRVFGDEPLRPERATLAGVCTVLPLEERGVRSRLVDIPLGGAAPVPSALLLRELLAEAPDPVVALRGTGRWVRGYERLPAGATPDAAPLRRGGVYLVTGGLGGIGLGLAERLAAEYGARLVLFGRTGVGGDPERQARVRRLRELGAEVEVVIGDISRPEDALRAVRTATTRFGALHGVLHAAGVPAQGLIQLKSGAEAAAVLAPKVAGTSALMTALRETTPDFLVLFGSIAAITGGGPGQVDYCAANAFLDARAHASDDVGYRVVAVDWGEWEWNGWADGLGGHRTEMRDFFHAHRKRFGIGFDEGWRTLLRVLAGDATQVVVSTQDFAAVERVSRRFTVDVARGRPSAGTRHGRPELATPYVAPRPGAERLVADVWAEVLGLERVGADDNFFELGGNSLIGVETMARLRDELGAAELAPHVLYQAPTVATLAAVAQGDPAPVDGARARSARERADNRRRSLGRPRGGGRG